MSEKIVITDSYKVSHDTPISGAKEADKSIIENLADKPLPKPYDLGDGQLVHPTPCIKSGFCCTTAPCAYGEWNADRSACKYLEAPNDIGQRNCGRYQWIKDNVPGWENYPAFGGGCCMPLGNTLRSKIIENVRNTTK